MKLEEYKDILIMLVMIAISVVYLFIWKIHYDKEYRNRVQKNSEIWQEVKRSLINSGRSQSDIDDAYIRFISDLFNDSTYGRCIPPK